MGDKQPEPEKGQKVLVALDGTNYSLRAFRVINSVISSRELEAREQWQRDNFNDIVFSMRKELQEQNLGGVPVQPIHRKGLVRHELAKTIREHGIELTVVGSSPYSSVSLLSISSYLKCQTKSNVMVHPPKFIEKRDRDDAERIRKLLSYRR